jgi:hypothetical protein
MIITNNTNSKDLRVVNCNSISEKQQVFWAGIARDNEILVQAGHIAGSKLAQQLLLHDETPGFEYHTPGESPFTTTTTATATADAQETSASSSSPEWRGRVFQPPPAAVRVAEKGSYDEDGFDQQSTRQLKGVKFHLYETTDGINKANSDSMKTLRMWVYCAVYDTSTMSLKTVKAFMGKIIEKTKVQRTRYNKDGCHESFRSVLLREMQAISCMSKREVRTQLDTIQDLIRANVEILLAATPSEDDSNGLREARYHQMIRTAQYGAMPLQLRSGSVV